MGHAHSAHHEAKDEAAPESVEIAEVGGSQGEADLAQGREAAEVSSGSSAKKERRTMRISVIEEVLSV